jgi:hypothetical protein
MTSTTTQPDFKGPYRDELSDLSALMEELWEEHGTSWVRAGDNQVYCLGGAGYIIVFDEQKWRGLVEVYTPEATISIRRSETGEINVAAPNIDEKAIKSELRAAIDTIRNYYKNRYWQTP